MYNYRLDYDEILCILLFGRKAQGMDLRISDLHKTFLIHNPNVVSIQVYRMEVHQYS